MRLGRVMGWPLACAILLAAFPTLSAPKIVFNLTDTPYPTAPFPNNIFTVSDPLSTTGLKVRYPVWGKTEFERGIRKQLNQLNGFSTYAAISVPFDSAIDIHTLHKDSVYLIQLQKNSADYGRKILLDFGSGLFDYNSKAPLSYFRHDPLKNLDQFVFPTNNRVSFYEDQTHTLLLRPSLPLDEETRYAVLLTRHLQGEDGQTIVSEQKTNAALLAEITSITPFDAESIVYAWDFTTQTITSDLKRLRQCLHGQGACRFLADHFQPRLYEISDLGNSALLTPVILRQVIVAILELIQFFKIIDPYPIQKMLNLDHVDYFLFGKFLSPQFNKNDSHSFQIDPARGIAPYESEAVTFMLAVPKQTSQHRPPFPVVIFGHGNKRSRIDTIALANLFAQAGLATLTIDAAGHGPEHALAAIPVALRRYFRKRDRSQAQFDPPIQKIKALAKIVGFDEQAPHTLDMIDEYIDKLFNYGILRVLTQEGRAVDVDEDGVVDSGETFFTGNLFQTRDIIRQTIIDTYQSVRVLQSLGIDHNQDGALDPLEGDFNRDGIADIGGPSHKITYAGMSLGGILGALLLPTEPGIQTGVLNVPGGGLTDILVKTASKFSVKRIYHQVMGPVLTGIYDGEVTHLVLNSEKMEDSFKMILPLKADGLILFHNLTKNLSFQTHVNALKGFFAQIPADRGDTLELQAYLPNGQRRARIEFKITHQQGLGYPRNTSEFRKFVSLAQWIGDPADPINYARALKDKNALLQIALGDWTVPVSTGINLARAAGLISPERLTWLLSQQIHEGAVLPVDTPPYPPETRQSAAVRFHPSDRHEYLIIPNLESAEKKAYTTLAQEQIVRYFLSDGGKID